MKPTPLFSNIQTGAQTYDDIDKATYKGITIKTVLLFLITVAVALTTIFVVPRYVVATENMTPLLVGLIIAMIVALISALVGRLSYNLAMPFSIIYSLSMGFLLGFITEVAEEFVPGIAITAVFATLIIFGIMLLLFFTGVIKPSRKLLGIGLGFLLGAISLSLFTLIMAWTGVISLTAYLWLLLLIEAIYLIYAVVMLTFNFCEAVMVVNNGAIKKAEWSVALGLMSALAYIYVELLRILLIIASIVGNNN